MTNQKGKIVNIGEFKLFSPSFLPILVLDLSFFPFRIFIYNDFEGFFNGRGFCPVPLVYWTRYDHDTCLKMGTCYDRSKSSITRH